MARLSLTLFGSFQIELNERLITEFESDRVRSLLAYLVVEADRPHARSILATLLWPDQPETRARTNLRHVLYELRNMLADDEQDHASADFLLSTRQTLQFNPASSYSSDVKTFVGLMAECEAHAHTRLATCADCMPRLSQAVLLYRGTFLLGLNLAGSAPFEEWVRMMQERLHRQVLQGLHALTTFAETHGDWPTALRYAYQQVELEPWREEAHQQLMRAQAHNGQRSAALSQFETLRQLLNTELGVAPSPESVAVYEQIRSNTLQPARAEQPREILQPVAQWGDVPDIGTFYGRQTELLELQTWAVQNRSRVVSVLGLGGMGKTALVATFARTHQHAFDRVLWRSLVNAPPLDEMLRTTLQSLIDASTISSDAASDSASMAVRTSLPATLDGQLALLLDYLRRQRCLLVLDNLESLLQAETAGAFRPGYEDYGQLIQRVAEYEHQSCLLLTSREQPNVFLRLDDATPTSAQNPAVRTLHLNGLDDAAAGAMLSARGLAGQSSDGVMLAERYSRNPLALKLVSLTVQEMFGGDIAAYLTGETLIFDDIRTVLDQQFSRLTELERDIMIWLAIEREPTSFQTLRENVLQPLRVHTLVEALRSLQRRSLVGHSPSGFVLQNVVMEYTTGVLIERICSEIQTGFNTKSAVEPLAFNRYALLKAQSREYVRASQARLILDPVATQLLASLGRDEIAVRVKTMTAALRAAALRAAVLQRATLHSRDTLVAGYAAGNAINLLLHMGVDLCGYDFSNLCVWQAYMQGRFLADVNFSGSNLARSVFTYVFGKIEDIHFDTDRNLLVVGSMDGKLRLWRAADGQLLHEYQSFGADVRFAVLSHDGRMLASGHSDHQIRIWDVMNGHLLQTFPGHAESLWGLAFSPNGEMLASASGNGELRLWNVQTGLLLHILQNHKNGVPALVFTPDSQILASGDVDGIVCVYRIEAPSKTPTLIRQFQAHSEEVHALVFDGTSTRLITSSHDRTISVWDIGSWQKLRTLKAHTLPIRSLGLSMDGHTLASIGEDQFACLWDVRTGQLLHTFTAPIHFDPILKFSQDGRRLAIVGAHPSVDLWDVTTGQRLDTLQSYSNHVTSVAIHADGTLLASGGSDRMVRLWQLLPDGTELQSVRLLQGHKRAVLAVAFGPDGRTLASADEEPNIRLWDIDTGRVIRILDGHTNKVESIQFSRDGQRLVSASHDRTIRVWDVQNHQRYLVLRGHTDSVRTCAISPDGQWVASGSSDRTVRLWDLRSPLYAPGQISLVLPGHTNGIRCVAFSPDSHILVSVSYDQTMRLWDVQNGGHLIGVWPFQTIVLSATFHPDGNMIATGTGDYRVSLWDVHTGQLRRELRGHTHRIESLCFSPDGQWLISASFDETIRIWDVETALAGGEALVNTLRADGPYAGMNITGVTGISLAQKAVLRSLGALEGG